MLAKEMGNLMIAFDILEPGQKAPPGWHKATGHIIFDAKMDFTWKDRWVKDGHKTPNSTTSSYAGVVSPESIRIITNPPMDDLKLNGYSVALLCYSVTY